MTKEDFMRAYNSKNMYAYAMSEERCHTGKAPTLFASTHEYGRDTVLNFIDDALQALINFTSAKGRLTDEQRQRLAWVVLTQFGWLRTTEILLFVVKAQAGQFGKFYNQIDPLDITAALQKWAEMCRQRRNEIRLAQIEKDRDAQRDLIERTHRAHIDEIRTMLLNGLFDFNLHNK